MSHLSIVACCLCQQKLSTDRVQGSNVLLKADHALELSLASLYCNKFVLDALHANIHLGVAHGDLDINIAESGSLCIDSLEGNLSLRLRKGVIKVSSCFYFDVRANCNRVVS